MTIDPALRRAIAFEVKDTLREINEVYQEQWLTGKSLGKQIELFTPSWLKTYGHTLPRTRAEVADPAGNIAKTSWVYPLHKIQRMVQDGQIKDLKVERLASRSAC